MKGSHSFYILTTTTLIIVLLAPFLLLPIGSEKKTIDMSIAVGDHIGFAIGTPGLNFGTVPAGGSSSREIEIDDGIDGVSNVHLRVTGELHDWTYFSDNDFSVSGDEPRLVKIRVLVPPDAEPKSYTGRLEVNIKKLED